jgi:hypothetical protein
MGGRTALARVGIRVWVYSHQTPTYLTCFAGWRARVGDGTAVSLEASSWAAFALVVLLEPFRGCSSCWTALCCFFTLPGSGGGPGGLWPGAFQLGTNVILMVFDIPAGFESDRGHGDFPLRWAGRNG